MNVTHARRNVPTEHGLHPAIYGALIGCTVWMLAAFWTVFGHDTYTGLQLAVSTFFCAMFIGVPFWLRRLSGAVAPDAKHSSLRDWASHELSTACGPVEGRQAIVMILLAPAAIALGITGISFIAYLAAHGAL
jgi:hypothetical protein